MRWILWKPILAVLFTFPSWLCAAPGLSAQSTNGSRSLGGYGAANSVPLAGMGSTSSMIPYSGGFGGFMPYRMAGGASSPLTLSTRASSALESTRTSFRLSPMSSGMGTGIGPSRGLLTPLGLQNSMRFGSAPMNQPMGAGTNTSVTPPSFGYPFYQPPSLMSPVSATSGMSM